VRVVRVASLALCQRLGPECSYIARGQEITEITKTIKRAFRKPEFVHIQCAIPKKPAWRAGADLFITGTTTSPISLLGSLAFVCVPRP
jgi:hypothetical protein